jgi:transcriptional regulator with XRE-family HTH domain
MSSEERIGRKIRDIRRSRQVTLQALASATGLTKGYLSKVENSGKAAPVSTIFKIARALEVNPADLFVEAEPVEKVSVVRNGQREVVARGTPEVGYTYESLCGGMAGKQILAYMLTVPPKGASSLTQYEHEGEELLVVSEGSMVFHYGGQDIDLEEGDSVFFDPSAVHSVEAHGSQPAKVIMIVSAPSRSMPAGQGKVESSTRV